MGHSDLDSIEAERSQEGAGISRSLRTSFSRKPPTSPFQSGTCSQTYQIPRGLFGITADQCLSANTTGRKLKRIATIQMYGVYRYNYLLFGRVSTENQPDHPRPRKILGVSIGHLQERCRQEPTQCASTQTSAHTEGDNIQINHSRVRMRQAQIPGKLRRKQRSSENVEAKFQQGAAMILGIHPIILEVPAKILEAGHCTSYSRRRNFRGQAKWKRSTTSLSALSSTRSRTGCHNFGGINSRNQMKEQPLSGTVRQ